jgi:peptidoglycan/xylan/chitin deacetylase (PgdA/CDA1 family)
MTPRTTPSLRIITYHRFKAEHAEPLSDQCVALRSSYEPVTLGDGLSMLRSRRNGAQAVAVTVDDGHEDFFAVGAPVFATHGIAVTCYLVTDVLQGDSWFWCDEVDYLFQHAVATTLRVDTIEKGRVALPLSTEAHRRRSLSIFKSYLKMVPDERRRAIVSGLPERLKVSLPAQPLPEYRFMTWDQARYLLGRGVQFGAHTRTHPILSRVMDDDILADEIVGSKRRIETELRQPVAHFCYPNGTPVDITPSCDSIVKAAAFSTAVTTSMGLNQADADPFALKRIWVEPHFARSAFEARVACS